MLVFCNKICKETTDASLDVDEDVVVCNQCGESLEHITKFAKLSMKLNGDVKESKNRKAFVFKCKTHGKMTEVFYKNSRLKGRSCPNNKEACLIDITESMKIAVKEYGSSDE